MVEEEPPLPLPLLCMFLPASYLCLHTTTTSLPSPPHVLNPLLCLSSPLYHASCYLCPTTSTACTVPCLPLPSLYLSFSLLPLTTTASACYMLSSLCTLGQDPRATVEQKVEGGGRNRRCNHHQQHIHQHLVLPLPYCPSGVGTVDRIHILYHTIHTPTPTCCCNMPRLPHLFHFTFFQGRLW